MICRPKTSERRTSLNIGWVLRLINSSVIVVAGATHDHTGKMTCQTKQLPLVHGLFALLCLPISHQRQHSSNVLTADICMPSGHRVTNRYIKDMSPLTCFRYSLQGGMKETWWVSVPLQQLQQMVCWGGQPPSIDLVSSYTGKHQIKQDCKKCSWRIQSLH